MSDGSASAPAQSKPFLAQASLALPEHRLLAERRVDAVYGTPFVYREYAYWMAPGMDLGEAERLLGSKIHEVMAELESQRARKFVQLAVFDHVFTDRPERAPLAVLSWKDWHGAPTLVFPSEPSRVSQWPFGGDRIPAISMPPPSRLPAQALDAPRPGSSKPVVKRRDPVADLVSDLFDKMHELAFRRAVAEGAEFVAEVTSKMIPVKHCLVHIFDIDSGDFVLVSARGALSESVLFSRIADRDPWVSAVMRRGNLTRATAELGAQPRWQTLGTIPTKAVCVPVRLGGRYLGLLELVDPVDGGDFFENETNALTYLAERFAEFLSNRPIVLDRDVVMSSRSPSP